MKQYDKDSIVVLEGIDAIQQRPQMYIGSLDKSALIKILFEIILNSVDEYQAGFGKTIIIDINKITSEIKVRDFGRGIPTGNFKNTNKSIFEILTTKIHSGGKFGKKQFYQFASGLHGVGMVVTNALSEFFQVKVFKGNKIFFQKFKNGKKIHEQQIIENITKEKNGTEISFKLKQELFDENISFTDETFFIIKDKLLNLSLLNNNINFILDYNQKKINVKTDLSFKDFFLFKFRNLFVNKKTFYYVRKHKNNYLELCFALNPHSNKEVIFSFVNNIETYSGTHVTALKSIFTRFFNTKAMQHKLLKYDENKNIIGEDIRNVLCFAVNLKMPDPRFSSQVKNKLTNKITSDINFIFKSILEEFYSINKIEFLKILKLCLESRNKRLFHVSKKNLQNIFNSNIIPCISKNKKERELIIVEGLSASGIAKKARNSKFQAIFALRGKILNIAKIESIEKIYNNFEISTLINTIGYPYDKEFNDIKYNKIVILSDADPDGHHITLLLITFFFKFMKNIIKNKHLYIALPPLFCVRKKSSGKIISYFDSDKELKKFFAKKTSNSFYVTRLKGLGEMNFPELKEQIFDCNDNIYQVTESIEKDADLIMINNLMGLDVKNRKIFVLKNADK